MGARRAPTTARSRRLAPPHDPHHRDDGRRERRRQADGRRGPAVLPESQLRQLRRAGEFNVQCRRRPAPGVGAGREPTHGRDASQPQQAQRQRHPGHGAAGRVLGAALRRSVWRRARRVGRRALRPAAAARRRQPALLVAAAHVRRRQRHGRAIAAPVPGRGYRGALARKASPRLPGRRRADVKRARFEPRLQRAQRCGAAGGPAGRAPRPQPPPPSRRCARTRTRTSLSSSVRGASPSGRGLTSPRHPAGASAVTSGAPISPRAR